MEVHNDVEQLIEICGPFVEKRFVRCKYDNNIVGTEVSSSINMEDLTMVVGNNFPELSGKYFRMAYSFVGGPYVTINNDNDIVVMLKSQLRVQSNFIDITIETDVGNSSGGVLEDECEPTEVNEGFEFDDNMPKDTSRPRLSALWRDYIKGVNQKFFGGVKEFRSKLEMYAAEVGFDYKIVRNNPSIVTAECSRKKDDQCLWRVHATKSNSDGAFVIRTMNNTHTCNSLMRQSNASGLSSKVISSLIVDVVRKKPEFSAKEVVQYIDDVYRFQIPYATAYYALDNAKKTVLGDGASSYAKLCRYIELLRESNPGSYCVLERTVNSRRFKRVFIALDACIRGFRFCRPVLSLDGTFLTSKYKGTLLVAAGKDADRGMYPLAYAVVGSETYESWKWFMQNLADILNRDNRVVSFISDRNLGLVRAVRETFPNNPYAFCIKHMSDNLETRFPGTANAEIRAAAVAAFKKAAYACTESLFEQGYNELLAINRGLVMSFLRGTELHNWANMYFRGERYGDMCSNIAETFNNWVRVERLMAITELLDGIRVKLMRRFANRSLEAANWKGILTPQNERTLAIAAEEGRDLIVIRASQAEFEVVVTNGKYVVNVVEGSCSCNRWRIRRFPCKHAVTVYKRSGIDIYQHIDHVFLTSTFRDCYANTIHPVINDPYEILTLGGPDAMLPPETTRPAGRPSVRRKRSRRELSRHLKCSRCGKSDGHNRKTCTEPIG